jgi:hypothetical protein
MDSITLKRAVTIVAIVTEDLKQQLRDELGARIAEVDNNVQQLDAQSRRYMLELQRTNLQQAMALRERVDQEKMRHHALKSELQDQLQEVENLELDSEFRRGVLEGTVELKVGDSLPQSLYGAEIVMKDGIVQALRLADVSQISQASAELPSTPSSGSIITSA